ncbi:MAG: hypothetical protein IT423_01660 [Pirellulaceae bacterium]|nr:hypothetical protein [Pirellulaceae bacterium]
MKIDDLSGQPDMLADIETACVAARQRLNLNSQQTSPESIVAAIDAYLCQQNSVQSQTETGADAPPLIEDEDIEECAFELGCLWGQQLTLAFQWKWVQVRLSDDQHAVVIGVTCSQQTLVIYPFQYIFQLLDEQDGRTISVSIFKAFQLLNQPSRIPLLPPNSMENVMEHVH